MMKLTVLIENTAGDPSLTAEHGLSILIETGKRRYLFDTGATGAFVENACRMGVDLGQVDAAILSHGHYDHGGGLEAFMQCNPRAPVYVSAHAFTACYNASGKYIGLPASLKDHPRLIPVLDRLTLAPGVWLDCCPQACPRYPQDSGGLQKMEHGTLLPDTFEHELYLLVQENKRICFSGCAHRGIENIVHWLKPDVLVGGFHFKQLQPGEERLTLAARRLLEHDCDYYTCHCTGQAQYAYLKEIMKNRLHYLSTGDIIEI